MRYGDLLIVFSVALAAAGCQRGLTDKSPLPARDEAYFRCHVQPIVTKSCSAFACHGSAQRYFHVFARNRLRLGGTEAQRNAILRTEEGAFNFDAARAFIDESALDESLLLLKPLEAKEGGYYHGGATLFGKGNVFLNRDDPDFKIISAWVHGAKEVDQQCIEPGSDL
jgi:hypothetical protein